jgi:hypothetical protein
LPDRDLTYKQKEIAMNRAFDERFELQLQEYEFAELDQLLPSSRLLHGMQEEAEPDFAMLEIVNRN